MPVQPYNAFPNQFRRDLIQEAIRHVFARVAAAHKPSGILAPVEADARRYLEWGATFVAVGSDLGLFRAATQGLRDKYASA